MPRHHEHEHQIAALLRRIERSHALLDHAQALFAMARQSVRAAHHAQQRRLLQEAEQQVLGEMVGRHALDESAHEPYAQRGGGVPFRQR